MRSGKDYAHHPFYNSKTQFRDPEQLYKTAIRNNGERRELEAQIWYQPLYSFGVDVKHPLNTRASSQITGV
jgi:hypothetical protein